MPRRKISEFRSKVLVSNALNLPYVGWCITKNKDLEMVHGHDSYVIKVDQAEKKRFKKGLVFLDVKQEQLHSKLKLLQKKGYDSFIVEPYSEHADDEERYLSVTYDRNSYAVSFSTHGGIDIEDNSDTVTTVLIDKETDWKDISKSTGFLPEQLEKLIELFKREYFTLLEINPYIVSNNSLKLLDAAVEVDDAGLFFVDQWTVDDFRYPVSIVKKTPAEESVSRLDEKSPASFNLSVLNPNGSIFLLLSGGGASVVVADEIHNRGLGEQIANYGEYSGNPTEYETYIYTSALLSLLLASASKKKVLFIGGAVANFTDIANTFAGVIKALDENATELQLQNIKVFVRRGGPRQEIGLKRIREALEGYGLLGEVYDPTTSIHEAVSVLVDEVKQ